ncbi:MAG: EVE domain-containing protein [Planctomycetota bacterium]
MPAIELKQLLELVGDLQDSEDPKGPAQKFRHYLRNNLNHASDARDYVQQALRESGPQMNRALQDIVNRIGELLDFKVEYGRYVGKQGEIGFDGLWQSETGWWIVVECKTTDTYAVKTETLLNYINSLVSSKKISGRDKAMGLCAFGRLDSNASQLENAIIVENLERQLRVITIETLLKLLELRETMELSHEQVIQLLLPASSRIDPLVEFIAELYATSSRETEEAQANFVREDMGAAAQAKPVLNAETKYYLLPAHDEGDSTAREIIATLLKEKIWGLGPKTRFRGSIKKGDRICFYASGLGVVATATAAGESRKGKHKLISSSYPYLLHLDNVKFLPEPVEISSELRSNLDKFEKLDPEAAWGWFVVGTSNLTKRDFELLTSTGT